MNVSGFWNFVVLRLHFAFGIVKEGRAHVESALESAYVPVRRYFFAVPHTWHARHLPVLNALSIQLLGRDYNRLGLGHDASKSARPIWATADLESLLAAAELTTAGPLDETLLLSLAGQDPEVEALALDRVQGSYLTRTTDFLTRVCLVPPDRVGPGLLPLFTSLWRHHWDNRGKPDDFWYRWFDLFIPDVLAYQAPFRAGPSDCPVWMGDEAEWLFIAGCHNVLRREERAALFLILWSGLNIRQVVRLLHGRAGLADSRPGDGPDDAPIRVMGRLAERWAAIMNWMAGVRRQRTSAN
jgi:hypothetical protein